MLLTGIFIFHFACDWRVNVADFFYVSACLQFFLHSYFMFHLPYMDVYFNLPIKNYPHIYPNKRLIFYMYMWICLFECFSLIDIR